jgi:hypothetical protein
LDYKAKTEQLKLDQNNQKSRAKTQEIKTSKIVGVTN